MIGSVATAAARLQSAYQTLLRPAVRATLAIETYGAAELRTRTGPMIFLVGDGERVDRAVVVSGLPGALRHRTVPAHDEGQATRLLERGWNVVVSAEDQGRILAAAVRLQMPIVPVGIRGTVAAVEPGRILPRPGRPRVAVRYGLPLRQGVGETPTALIGRADRAVQALIAEDAATWWSVRRHPADPPAADVAGAAAPSGWRRTWRQTERPLIGGRQPPRRIWQR